MHLAVFTLITNKTTPLNKPTWKEMPDKCCHCDFDSSPLCRCTTRTQITRFSTKEITAHKYRLKFIYDKKAISLSSLKYQLQNRRAWDFSENWPPFIFFNPEQTRNTAYLSKALKIISFAEDVTPSEFQSLFPDRANKISEKKVLRNLSNGNVFSPVYNY